MQLRPGTGTIYSVKFTDLTSDQLDIPEGREQRGGRVLGRFMRCHTMPYTAVVRHATYMQLFSVACGIQDTGASHIDESANFSAANRFDILPSFFPRP
jgi:hypothetical protein